MKYSYLFLDVAGTLLFKEGLYNAIHSCIQEAGFSVPENELRNRHNVLSDLITVPNYTSKTFYDSFNKEFLYSLGIIPTRRLIDQLYTRCKKLCWKAYNDVEMLERVHIPKGIISNWDKTLERKLRSLIPFHFSHVFGSGMMNTRKPNEDIFRNAFVQTDVPFEQIMYIGDSVKLDIEPTVLLGIYAVLLDRENQFPWYTGPRIRTLSEVTHLLRV